MPILQTAYLHYFWSDRTPISGDECFCLYIKKKMWYDCQRDNSPQETKMTQKLTTIGHRTVFSNEQSPYRIVSYKRPRNDNVKQFKREN